MGRLSQLGLAAFLTVPFAVYGQTTTPGSTAPGSTVPAQAPSATAPAQTSGQNAGQPAPAGSTSTVGNSTGSAPLKPELLPQRILRRIRVAAPFRSLRTSRR